MSETPDDELELQALSRQLDDAFETTRPRAGFDDELWARMQARRPAGIRIGDALRGLVQGIREVPAVPMAGIAALLVVVIGAGLFAYSGLGRGGGSTASKVSAPVGLAPGSGQASTASFGRLPSPVLAANPRTGGSIAANPTTPAGAAPADYAGPVQLSWSGQLNVAVATAPVFRYEEPSTTAADQFAAALGAVLRSRPVGLLGSYEATDYTLEVRGTVQSPPQSPAYFVYSAPSMPPVEAAGAGPADIALLFLAQHSLVPQWSYDVTNETQGELVRVIFERQFTAAGYGPAYLVDTQGQRYGMEVDLNQSSVVHVSGVLPLPLDSAQYPIISADAAVRAAIGTGTAVPVTGTPSPAVNLTRGELAYLLVPAGDHSFYEPVYLFSGTFQLNGTTYVKHVLVPAVDPSQRKP